MWVCVCGGGLQAAECGVPLPATRGRSLNWILGACLAVERGHGVPAARGSVGAWRTLDLGLGRAEDDQHPFPARWAPQEARRTEASLP